MNSENELVTTLIRSNRTELGWNEPSKGVPLLDEEATLPVETDSAGVSGDVVSVDSGFKEKRLARGWSESAQLSEVSWQACRKVFV